MTICGGGLFDQRPEPTRTAQAKALRRFDAERSESKKEDGIAVAAQNRQSVLNVARSVARELAIRNEDGVTNCDEVQRVLSLRYGWTAETLGPAAGAIFKGPDWRFTGRRIKSASVRNHARELKVWRYIGDGE